MAVSGVTYQEDILPDSPGFKVPFGGFFKKRQSVLSRKGMGNSVRSFGFTSSAVEVN